MGQYLAAAPECLVVRVCDDNSDPRPRVRSHIVGQAECHCLLSEESEHRLNALSLDALDRIAATNVIGARGSCDCRTLTIAPTRRSQHGVNASIALLTLMLRKPRNIYCRQIDNNEYSCFNLLPRRARRVPVFAPKREFAVPVVGTAQ